MEVGQEVELIAIPDDGCDYPRIGTHGVITGRWSTWRVSWLNHTDSAFFDTEVATCLRKVPTEQNSRLSTGTRVKLIRFPSSRSSSFPTMGSTGTIVTSGDGLIRIVWDLGSTATSLLPSEAEIYLLVLENLVPKEIYGKIMELRETLVDTQNELPTSLRLEFKTLVKYLSNPCWKELLESPEEKTKRLEAEVLLKAREYGANHIDHYASEANASKARLLDAAISLIYHKRNLL